MRILDILISGLGLVILAPLFLPITILLKLTGEGEIFFMQERIGRNGEVFKLFKFATMLKNSPNIGSRSITMNNDPRVLPVGSILRKTKINELPQLLNVFMGDMSLIGPRPLTRETFEAYQAETQKIIKTVRPGLSGVGSIIFRHEEKIMSGEDASTDFYIDVIAPYKGKLEIWFVANRSIYLYFLIIFLTIWVVIIPRSSLPWTAIRSLPEPPVTLKNKLTL